MTHPRHTSASLTVPELLDRDRLDDADIDKTLRRAWIKPMTVRPFGDAYFVECDDEVVADGYRIRISRCW